MCVCALYILYVCNYLTTKLKPRSWQLGTCTATRMHITVGQSPRCFHTCLCVFRAEHYWWRGQNRRTLRVGQFPRHVVTSVAGLSAQDISRPLKHSFIHTGHGDTDPQRSWGHADRIDRLMIRYLQ